MSLFALCLGVFMVMIDVMIVAVALPAIASNLHGSISDLQWVVDGYTLMFTCLLLSAGTVGDRLGARTAFIVGLLLFVLTSIGCGLAPSVFILILFRFLQGMSAAFILPTSIALINASYNEKKARTNAIGIWATVGSIAAASAPAIGAIITSLFGWRGIFFVNVPIGIIAIILTIKYVVSPMSKETAGFDSLGQITAMIGLATLAFGLIEAGRMGWFSSTVLVAFLLSVISTIIFLVIEHFSKCPMMPLSFFKSKTFSSTMVIGMMVNIGFYGVLFTLPLYFQQIRSYSIFMSGIALTPLMLLNPFASYFSGKLVGIIGSRLPMMIGLMISVVGFLSLLITDNSSPSYAWLLLPFVAVGVGTSFTMPAAMIAIIHSVPTDRAGIASGLFNASRQLGSLIGVAIFGTIITTSNSFVSGMHTSLIMAGCTYLFGCMLASLAKG